MGASLTPDQIEHLNRSTEGWVVPEAGMKALTESGLTLADMATMGAKMQGLDARSEAECTK